MSFRHFVIHVLSCKRVHVHYCEIENRIDNKWSLDVISVRTHLIDITMGKYEFDVNTKTFKYCIYRIMDLV